MPLSLMLWPTADLRMQKELWIGITIVVGFVALIIFALGRSGKIDLDDRSSPKRMPGKN